MASLKSTRRNYLNSLNDEATTKKASTSDTGIISIQQNQESHSADKANKSSILQTPILDNITNITENLNDIELISIATLSESLNENNNDTIEELSNINKNVNREFLTTKNYLKLDFDLLSNNKKDIRYLNQIVGKKNEVINSLFNNIENQFKSVLKRINNYSFIKNKIEEKIKNKQELINDINNGLMLRKETIEKIDLGKKLYSRLTGNKTISDLNLITNYFIENYEKVDLSQRNNQKENKFSLDVEEYDSVIKVSGSVSEIAQLNLMLDFNNANDNILTDSTGLVVQNFINNARSLYTLMPNCILEIDSDKTYYSKKINSNNNLVFAKENKDVVIWESINAKRQKISYESLIDNNNVRIDNKSFILQSDKNNSKIIINKISVNKSLNNFREKNSELSGEINNTGFNIYQGDINLLQALNNDDMSYLSLLSNETSNLVNLCLANRAEFAPYLSAYLDNLLLDEETRLINKSNHSFLREADVLSGKFYSQSLNYRNDSQQKYIIGSDNTTPESTGSNINMLPNIRTLNTLAPNKKNELRSITASFKKTIEDNVFNIFYQNLPMFETIDYGDFDTEFVVSQSLETLFSTKNAKFKNNLGYFYNNYNFDHTNFKIKIDALTKNIKLERLLSLGIDIKPYSDIVNNIKRSKNKLYFSEYSHDDKEMTCILNEENRLFNTLFTKNSQDEYVNNVSFNYRNSNINGKNYKANTADNVLNTDTHIVDIMSNYYPSGQFFSTTSLIMKLLNNFNNYVKRFNNEDKNRDEIVSEMFYMRYFSRKNNKDTLNTIAKRFMFNSIFNDKNIYNGYGNQLKSYQYDSTIFDNYKEKITKELKDFVGTEEEAKNRAESILLELQEQYLNSNDDLKIIKNEVYSEEMMEELSKEYDYKLVFANNFFDSVINESLSGKIVTLQNVFPFLVYTDAKKIRVPTNNDAFYDAIQRKIYTYKRSPEFVLTKDGSGYIINDENKNISFNNKHINFSVAFNRIKTGDSSGEIVESLFNFEENFEALCKSKTTIFGMICEAIREMLNVVDITYSSLNIGTEEEISNYIESNSKYVEVASDIIGIFADVYQNIIKNIIFDHTIKSFYDLIKPYTFDDKNSLLSDEFLSGDVATSKIIDTFNLSNDAEDLIFRESFEKLVYRLGENNGISKSIQILIDAIKTSDRSIIIKQNEVDFNNTLYKETNDNIFYRKMLHVINDIKRSDIAQAISFDISRSVLKQQKTINENIDNIKNQHMIDFANKLNLEENYFFESISSKYYQNVLIRNISNVEKRNVELTNIREGLINSPESYLQNNSLFGQVRKERLYKEIDYNANNVYSFSVNTSDMLNKNNNTLIKITIQPRDISESDRFYLPIVYYFSTNILSLNNSINENNPYIFVENEILTNEEYSNLDYSEISLEPSNNIDDNISTRIKEIISEKVTNDQTKINIIYDSIVENHRMSHKIKKVIAAKFDIDVNSINDSNREELTAVLNVIPDSVVANIFKTTKQELYLNIDDVKNYNEYYEMNNAVNFLLSSKSDNNKISDTKIYDRYLLSLPLNLFYAKPSDSSSSNNTPQDITYMYENVNFDLLTRISFVESGLKKDNQLSYFKDNFENNRKTLMFAIKMELL